MVLINQGVADEIGTLVARHRYAVEDGRDAVRAVEATSAQRAQEIEEAAARRREEVRAEAERGREQAAESQQPRNEWSAQRPAPSNEISFGAEDEEEFENPPRQAAPAAPAPASSHGSTSGRLPEFDDEEDGENDSWLR